MIRLYDLKEEEHTITVWEVKFIYSIGQLYLTGLVIP